MGGMLSLPLMGYLLMPSLTSYSTSINILFFYMTWSTLVLSQPPLKVEIVGTLAVRALFFLAPSLLFLLFDTIIPSLAVGMKTQGSAALPTRTGGVRVKKRSRGSSIPSVLQVLGLSLLNICLGVALQSAIELLFTEVLNIRSALKVSTTLPMPWSIFKDVVRGLLLREVLQYYIHRFVLHPSSSNPISKLHRSYFHSNAAPYSLTAHYDHPLPYILMRFLPTYLPSIIFRTHLLTYLLLLSIITLEETFSLSGYTTIPGIMVGGIARRQDLHSESHGKGNFAPWGLLDWVHGTSIGGDFMEDIGDEAQKHNIKERSGWAWGNAKESGKEGIRAWNGRTRSSRKG
ncbi:related to C-4 methyl sterol oxidase [Rhynchosporium graminicola]|uniref:Related to C-4 methyl sterol oxidase n=1 Tax=Rhynchosporium graminicola TaxID=2792576 RepID=A0A1E1JXW5_9HELO|nr:related to C-4 methyl sterol oxidase [Rhynchosporium commune]